MEVLTPLTAGPAVDLSHRLWRKQVLRHGIFGYRGGKIAFDAGTCLQLARSFRDGAFDDVSFQLADGENRHNEDPERRRGRIRALVATGDGLDALVEVDERGADLLENNPRLGVSCRIIPEVAVGARRVGAAVRHVLATLDPVVTGMRPWQPVQLAAARGDVIDLSNAQWPTMGADDLANAGRSALQAEDELIRHAMALNLAASERSVDPATAMVKQFQAQMSGTGAGTEAGAAEMAKRFIAQTGGR